MVNEYYNRIMDLASLLRKSFSRIEEVSPTHPELLTKDIYDFLVNYIGLKLEILDDWEAKKECVDLLSFVDRLYDDMLDVVRLKQLEMFTQRRIK